MPLNCVIIDDEPLAIALLRQYVEQFPELHLLATFDDAVAGKAYLDSKEADLLFIDINMPDIKGTEFVRTLDQKPMVVFTTAYKNYALEGFDLDALDYLLKPIAFERFAKAVSKAVEQHSLKKAAKADAGALFVRSEYQLVRINYDDIAYIESLEDYLKIHLSNGKPVMTLMTMKLVLEKLPASRFVRIHRSYIVPLASIKSVVNRKVNLGIVSLPVSTSYLHVIKDWMKG